MSNNSKPCTHKTTKTDENIDKVRNRGIMNEV
jgi:hypothetical protein